GRAHVDCARGGGRSGGGGSDRARVSGSAFRRGETELHPEAAARRRADRRREGARDRLAAAAHPAEPQREDPAGRRRLPRRVAAGADSRDTDGADHPRDGRRPPARQPALLARPGERQADREADRRQVLGAAAERPRGVPAAARRFHDAARYGGKGLAGEDGAVQGHQDRRLPPVVSELRRSVRPRHRRLCGAAARHPADAAAHARSHQRDEAAEREARARRAVLRSEDAERDRPRDRRRSAGDAAVGRGREGGHRLLQAVRLRHQPADRGDQESRSEVMLDASMLAFLLPPFVASLILTGIHAYLGVHVVERGVIFVDLSLAQIAALGGTIAILLPISGGDPHAPVVYWISLAFTFLGAFIFSTIRVKRARIPQEAIIGICYAVASAAAILAM